MLRECCEDLGELARDVLDLGLPVERIKVFYHVRPENLRAHQARHRQIALADEFGTWTRGDGWTDGLEKARNGSDAS